MEITHHAVQRYIERFSAKVNHQEARRRLTAALASAVEVYSDGETRRLLGRVKLTNRRRESIELIIQDGKVVTVLRP